MGRKKQLDQTPKTRHEEQKGTPKTEITKDANTNSTCYKWTSFDTSGWKVIYSNRAVDIEKSFQLKKQEQQT